VASKEEVNRISDFTHIKRGKEHRILAVRIIAVEQHREGCVIAQVAAVDALTIGEQGQHECEKKLSSFHNNWLI